MMAEHVRHHRRTKTTSVIMSIVMPKHDPNERRMPYEAEDTMNHNSLPSAYQSPLPQIPAFSPSAGFHTFLPLDHPDSFRPIAKSTSTSRAPSGGSSKSIMAIPSRQHRVVPPSSDSVMYFNSRGPSKAPPPAHLDTRKTILNEVAPRNETNPPKSVKSGTNLASMFGIGRPSRKQDSHPQPRDKENALPSSPTSSDSISHSQDEFPAEGPSIFQKSRSRPLSSLATLSLRPKQQTNSRNEETKIYTPSDRQNRDFFGADTPRLTKVDKHSRSKSEIQPKLDNRGPRSPNIQPNGIQSRFSRFAAFGIRSDKSQNPVSAPSEKSTTRGGFFRSKAPESSIPKSGLSRGQSKVADVVAAFNERARVAADPTPSPALPRTDHTKLETDFEAVLESRNIAPHQRVYMRTLKPEVKAQFIKSHQEAPISALAITPPTSVGPSTAKSRSSKIFGTRSSADTPHHEDPIDPSKETNRGRANDRSRWSTDRGRTLSLGRKKKEKEETKKRRPKSRVFTFGRSDKKKENEDGEISSTFLPKSPSSLSVCSTSENRGLPVAPWGFVEYLKKSPKPEEIEVGRMHRLRLLIRNETVEWVDEFIDLDGMQEIVDLLHRIMAVEWREDHEDQLLHETLLCLKGLCTTSRGLEDLPQVAPTLFPALIQMIFDRERKGPSEFNTRAIISNTLSSPEEKASRAGEILGYLRDPTPPESSRPLPWIQEMRRPRPYQLWCREAASVSKEVFWIFLHSLNVVPLPSSSSPSGGTNATQPLRSCVPTPAVSARNSKIISPCLAPADSKDLATDPPPSAPSYFQNHFPRPRPPVPAAPHVGGVEWDATNYIASHLDLLNGLMACLPTRAERNDLRDSLRASGWEKLMGGTLRRCKEKFYNSVHDGLRTWVASAVEDEWDPRLVRMGPPEQGSSKSGPTRLNEEPELLPNLDVGASIMKWIPL